MNHLTELRQLGLDDHEIVAALAAAWLGMSRRTAFRLQDRVRARLVAALRGG